jgi:hypothetical protein
MSTLGVKQQVQNVRGDIQGMTSVPNAIVVMIDRVLSTELSIAFIIICVIVIAVLFIIFKSIIGENEDLQLFLGLCGILLLIFRNLKFKPSTNRVIAYSLLLVSSVILNWYSQSENNYSVVRVVKVALLSLSIPLVIWVAFNISLVIHDIFDILEWIYTNVLQPMFNIINKMMPDIDKGVEAIEPILADVGEGIQKVIDDVESFI